MKSLELNWIRNVDKSLVMPEVIFSSLDTSGCYYRPFEGDIHDDGGRCYDASWGAIIIDSDNTNIESTIAHEWRHHWQCYHGYTSDSARWSDVQNKYKNYEDALVNYFLNSTTEMDALRFEYKHASIYPEWEEIFYDYLKVIL